MSHLTIYVKRSKGQLQYRDSEGNTGDTITSHAKHDEKIIWKLDKCSGISEITGIQLNLQLCGGSSFLLSDYFFLVVPLMPAHVLWPTAVCISLTQIPSFLLSRNVICS